MNSGICSQISSSCNCPIIRHYFVFKTVLVCFWNKLRRLSRNNIIRLIFTKNIVCRKQGREGQRHKYAVLLSFNLRSGVFFFRRKRKSRRTGKEDKKNAPFPIRLPNKREGGPPDSRLCFLSKTVCLPCLVRREWVFITMRSYGTKRTKI